MAKWTGESPPISRRTVLGVAAALGLAACGKSDESGSSEASANSEAVMTARDAYIFGYPLVLMDLTREASEATTPVNRFRHSTSLATAESRDIVRPNPDLLYSTAWLDLRAEPMVLQIPRVPDKRYWSMGMLGAWTNSIHNPSSANPQAVSPEPPFTYAVTGPGWSGQLPQGMTPMPMPTPTVWLYGGVEVHGESDIPAVRAIQSGFKLVPLSSWLAGTNPPEVRPPARRAPKQAPRDEVSTMEPRDFFDRMCSVMTINPPKPEDAPAMRRFATIGITPGGSVKGLSDRDLAAAVASAEQQQQVYLNPAVVQANGWALDPTVGSYGTNYLLRATVARRGLGAPRPGEAVTFLALFAKADPDSGQDRFRLHFEPGQAPPVNGFWSVCAYGPDDFLVPNSAGIYSVGHQVPVVLNNDGSFDLRIQHANPGPSVPVGNWLPIPESGQFTLTLYMFAPKPEAIDLRWQPPPPLPVA